MAYRHGIPLVITSKDLTKTYLVRSTTLDSVKHPAKQFPSKECGFKERDSQKKLNLRNVSGLKRFSDCVFNLRILLHAHKPLQSFGDISKTPPPFELKFSQVSFRVHIYNYVRLKQTHGSQKPKVYFAFKWLKEL